jgi:hypothetical protein
MASSTLPPISHILYIVPDSKGCELAVNIVKQYPALRKEIHLQDIKLIEKPAWLRGVPVLAKVATREIWEGSTAIEQLHYLAGYFSALQTVSSSSSQPWASYQTNLTLPQPVTTQAPTQGPSTASSSSIPPILSTSNLSPVQPPNVSLTSSPSLQTPTPSVPQVQPQPPVTLQRPQIQTPGRTESDPSDPNKVQPIPLPDDQRPQQELALPPPPENIKKHTVQTTTPPLVANPQTVSNPPPQPSRQSSRQPLSNPNTVQSLPPSLSSLPHPPPLPPPPLSQPSETVEVKPVDPVDHVAVVFTPDELDTIQRVMFKPKTLNKRPSAHSQDEVFRVDETLVDELRGRGRDVNSPKSSDSPNVRVFPVAERTHSTIVQKDEEIEEKQQPVSA